MFGIANRLVRFAPARKLIGHFRMMDCGDLHDFWRSPAPEGNVPADYLRDEDWIRSQALVDMIGVPRSASILEIGCNAGRNLAHLHRAGFTNLAGIEISPHAVELLRETFTELADVPVHLGAAEEILPELGPFDLVFTMAVLEHIHPASVAVFDHMARIAKTIIAIEPSSFHVSERQFPHDIKQLFTSRGFKLTSAQPMDHVRGLETYSAYRFTKCRGA